jgi:hypothetical protein
MNKAIIAITSTALFAQAVQAITFIPPNDPVGKVWTVNSNDGYDTGRGILFQVTANETISSVGIYQDLTSIALSFQLEQVGGPILSSGGSTVTTTGLQWVDYNIAPVVLVPGFTYHLDFLHQGNGNQNFFYNNGNVQWTQGNFTFLDGTQGGAGGAGNFVVAAFRMNETSQPAPDQGTTLLLLGLAATGLAAFGRMTRRSVA